MRKQQSQMIDDQHLVDTDGLVGDLKKAGATDLLLITKHRAAANLQAEFDSFGNGSLYGLGFYIDHRKRIRRSDLSPAEKTKALDAMIGNNIARVVPHMILDSTAKAD